MFSKIIISVDGEFAWVQSLSYLLPFSALFPCKHHASCLGLLRSRPDPFRKSTIEQDKTSTSGKRLGDLILTCSFQLAMTPICNTARGERATGLQKSYIECVFKSILRQRPASLSCSIRILLFFLVLRLGDLERLKLILK